jgi:hypothetical protein
MSRPSPVWCKKCRSAVPLIALLIIVPEPAIIAVGPFAAVTMVVNAPAPNQALARYFAGAGRSDPWSGPNTVFLEIDASLPKLAKQGCLRAFRVWAGHGMPDYQVIHIEGDSIVKEQLIARYLREEKRAAGMPASSVALTPANYKFHYIVSSGGGPTVYAFQTMPRKKRPGLIKGELWVDAATGIAVHETGYLVKRPSGFIRRFKITRDVSLRSGVPYLRTTQLDIDTRLVGHAEMKIIERVCADPPSTCLASNIVAAQGGGNNGFARPINH